ncbi:MAG: Gfo/Idh/MocA family oxidoreductase [Fusobacteriaceae bacterium]|jgi:predicted dehydrogenase|nr:Gfo/Idh/MocA family oxidoreductase [Fusobacteriaceae bacterium]
MKCALIGYGYWGKILEKYINTNHLFQMKYIYAPEIKTSITLDQIINDKELNCVFICTPIDTHYQITKKCLLNKKNVFCEKPLCKSSKEILDLIQLSKDNNICLYTDYIYTVSKSIDYIKNNINKIGKIKYIKASISQFGNFYKNDNVYSIITVHLISAILYILSIENINEIDVIKKYILRKDSSNILDSIVELVINKNIYLDIESSLTSLDKVRTIKIIGDNGVIKFDMFYKDTVRTISIEQKDIGYAITNIINVQEDESNNIKLAIDEFYNNIVNRKFENINLTLKVTETLEKIENFCGLIL